MRLYVPLTPQDVTSVVQASDITPDVVYAVTSDLVDLAPQADGEEHEHLATQFAAASCAGRIVVGVFDVRGDAAELPAAPSRVPGAATPNAPVSGRDLVCFLVGDEEVTVSEDADVELSWYDATEAADVARLLS